MLSILLCPISGYCSKFCEIDLWTACLCITELRSSVGHQAFPPGSCWGIFRSWDDLHKLPARYDLSWRLGTECCRWSTYEARSDISWCGHHDCPICDLNHKLIPLMSHPSFSTHPKVGWLPFQDTNSGNPLGYRLSACSSCHCWSSSALQFSYSLLGQSTSLCQESISRAAASPFQVFSFGLPTNPWLLYNRWLLKR